MGDQGSTSAHHNFLPGSTLPPHLTSDSTSTIAHGIAAIANSTHSDWLIKSFPSFLARVKSRCERKPEAHSSSRTTSKLGDVGCRAHELAHDIFPLVYVVDLCDDADRTKPTGIDGAGNPNGLTVANVAHGGSHAKDDLDLIV